MLEEFKKLADKEGLQKALDSAHPALLRGAYNELCQKDSQYIVGNNWKGSLEKHFGAVTINKTASMGKSEALIKEPEKIAKTP